MIIHRFAVILCLFLLIVLTACGTKDEQEVIEELEHRQKELEAYQSHGKMVVQTGGEPMTYNVEVWYKHPHFYRVAVKNVKKDITQILLRNKEGVFVLTPHLKKSFRFQSNWPETNGQVYLYQTLVNNIVKDKKRTFLAQEKQYQIDVTSQEQQHQMMPKQRIWLDQDLFPKKVNVLNQDNDVVISVNFERFKQNPSFDADAFDMERNLNQVTQPVKDTMVMAKETNIVDANAPAYIPHGSRLQMEHRISSVNGAATVLRYEGKKPFSLLVRHPRQRLTEFPHQGRPVTLDQSLGVLITKGQQKHLTWLADNLEYELIGKLPEQELIKIANTTFGQLK